MALFKWNVLKMVRDWKIRIILLALLVFLASYSTLYQERSIELPLDELREEYLNTEQIFKAIPSEDFETKEGQEIYDKLADQQRILGMQRYILSEQEGNTVEGFENIVSDYVDQGIEMTENQLSFYQADEFESRELLLTFMPPEEELRETLGFFNYLKENNVEIDWNPMSPSLVLMNLVNVMAGVFIFIIAAIFGADRFSRDQMFHWSVSQGLPYTTSYQWRQRTFISWALIWSVIIVGISLSYGINRLTVQTGSLGYPVQIYSGVDAEFISILEYTAAIILLTMLLSYVVIKLSTGLSWVFRNIYLTITVVVAVFYIPYIFTVIPAGGSFNPLIYLQILPVVDGMWSDIGSVNIWKLFVNILLLYIIVEVIFHFIFKLIPTRTGKLERRKQ
ncbi:hypothetical protein [Corticicoccus populi]|uniref:ABC transporter permease n=1 Tax=Corticicoccus populi TaxID=1812821 RepID=A0ABW5WXB8_9STAP